MSSVCDFWYKEEKYWSSGDSTAMQKVLDRCEHKKLQKKEGKYGDKKNTNENPLIQNSKITK